MSRIPYHQAGGPYHRKDDRAALDDSERQGARRRGEDSDLYEARARSKRENAHLREYDTETCMFCIINQRCMSLRMNTIISCGETVWFAAQTSTDAVNCFHALICPEPHISHIGQMEESMWQEIRDVKKCYRLMTINKCVDIAKARLNWTCEAISDHASDAEEERLTESILAEHRSREYISPFYVPCPPQASSRTPSAAQQMTLIPIFFEFHLPRISANLFDDQWKQRLSQGGHYTIDCMIVTQDEADKLKSALISEFTLLGVDARMMVEEDDNRNEGRQRTLRKLESKVFYKKELPHASAPPPYLYVDFGLTQAYLFILAPGDMTKKSVIAIVKNCIKARKPEKLDYPKYLTDFKNLYSEFDCFKPSDGDKES